MLLEKRPIAIRLAVICFFAVAVIGSICGLDPSVSCKRAVLAAVGGYIAGAIAVKLINAVLLSAMVTKKLEQQKENGSDNERQ